MDVYAMSVRVKRLVWKLCDGKAENEHNRQVSFGCCLSACVKEGVCMSMQVSLLRLNQQQCADLCPYLYGSGF